MYKSIDIASSRFVGFTKERLEIRYQIFSDIIEDKEALDVEIAEAATLRREVTELLEVFNSVEELGLDPSGMSAADILEIVTGESIDRLQKQTGGGLLAQDIVEKSSSAVKATTQATKKGINNFATWLANKTGGAN